MLQKRYIYKKNNYYNNKILYNYIILSYSLSNSSIFYFIYKLYLFINIFLLILFFNITNFIYLLLKISFYIFYY